ncbi:MAG: hypothetical protein R3330_02490 [Saprospiraceae bacterium]|nr:hypothetical protein [Saprospiraceae bacterium]
MKTNRIPVVRLKVLIGGVLFAFSAKAQTAVTQATITPDEMSAHTWKEAGAKDDRDVIEGGIGVRMPVLQDPFEVVIGTTSLTFDTTASGNSLLAIHHALNGRGDIVVNHHIDDNPTLQLGFNVTEGTGRSVNIRMAAKDLLTVRGTGLVGVNNINPASRLHVTDGDVQVTNGDIYIDDVSHGVIMRSPNGQCWRMTVDNSGQPVFQSVTCPN